MSCTAFYYETRIIKASRDFKMTQNYRELNLEWDLKSDPIDTLGWAFPEAVTSFVHKEYPDLADLFPLKDNWVSNSYLGNGWLAVRILQRNGTGVGIPVIETLKDADLDELTAKILPFIPRNHQELFGLLGSDWFAFDRFTYVGPYSNSLACWPDAVEHLNDWFYTFVFPEVLKRNQSRVLRAIPKPPQFSFERMQHALWILECDEEMIQGTAFNLTGVGLVSCNHVLGSATYAFRAHDCSRKYKITKQKSDQDIDLAILSIDEPLGEGLPMGSADGLKQMDHLVVAGFPNYRPGDSGVMVPGLVIGFRTVSSIRRVLTNAPIIAGNSGGPVIGKDNFVVGVAITGADRMEEAQETENHGIIPIDALKFLRN
jgi:Trypsin-like peptidase domain